MLLVDHMWSAALLCIPFLLGEKLQSLFRHNKVSDFSTNLILVLSF